MGVRMEAKTRIIVVWIVSGLLAVAFVLSGSAKLFLDPETAAETFEGFGLPAWLALFIGVCEISGGIGLLIPRLSGLAASGLVIIMLGAIYNHLMHTPPEQALPALVLGLLCAFVAYSRGLPFGSRVAVP